MTIPEFRPTITREERQIKIKNLFYFFLIIIKIRWIFKLAKGK